MTFVLIEFIIILIAVFVILKITIVGLIAALVFGVWLNLGGFIFILTLLSPTLGVVVTSTGVLITGTAGFLTSGFSGVIGAVNAVSVISGSAAAGATTAVGGAAAVIGGTAAVGGAAAVTGGTAAVGSGESVGATAVGQIISTNKNGVFVNYGGNLIFLNNKNEIQKLYYNNFKYNFELFPEIPLGKLTSIINFNINKLKESNEKNFSLRKQLLINIFEYCTRIVKFIMFNTNIIFLKYIFPILPEKEIDELNQKFPNINIYELIEHSKETNSLYQNIMHVNAKFNIFFSNKFYLFKNKRSKRSKRNKFIDENYEMSSEQIYDENCCCECN